MNKFTALMTNWGWFTKNRNAIYGISAISIIIFHFFENYLGVYKTGNIYLVGRIYNALIGSIGVEIFILLSGIGLFFSLSNNNSIKVFYKNRLRRILIPTLVIMTGYWII